MNARLDRPMKVTEPSLRMDAISGERYVSQDYFRDVYDHLVRSNATLEGLRDTISTAIQVNLSMVTIEESETTKRLAAWAGIFAVATAFAGIWGMNFEGMPELKLPWGYPAALAVIFSACGLVAWRVRRAGWL